MSNGGDSGNNSTKGFDSRFLLAIIVLGLSIAGVATLAGIILAKDGQLSTAQYVLTAVLPLLGTWVGTVLAYFESASRSVREMAKQLTPMEKLESIAVKLKMIPRADMVLLNITSSKPLDEIRVVGDILDTLKQKGRNRLPILDESDHPKYMIHRSMIDKYLARRTIEDGLSADELKQLRFKGDLLDKDEELRKLFETSFATVKEDANLANAKIEMDKKESCLDVFVTKNGTKNEAVIGWLTNLIITESAKV
jgi:hypothetical protein